ncbi:hypothetical protein V1638_00820 [Pseudarthrobacter sp. J64]|uniref:hypothetical protein n=1 Tax=Pseudarthrobacter sp. J64 TaxID=3116485 RepID=UPI002E822459|nr:hypothetical protein [Pseudarthrobacter sp. J64]MEE2567943.1 hypothetical protein [Pseudarthrobacter sp. J64]
MSENELQNSAARFNRRSVVKGAAWSVPVIAAAIAAPAASASVLDAGAFNLDGTCGVLGLLGPGFLLTAADTAPVPAGTVITITSSGIANIGVFSLTGGAAVVNVLSADSVQIVLTGDLLPGETLAMRTTLSITVAFTLNAVATLPAGYIGTGSDSVGQVSSTLILCSAS